MTADSAHGGSAGVLPVMIQALQVTASRGDLLNYLTIFRLLLRLVWSRVEQADTPSHRHAHALVVAHLLVEHLQICFNCLQWHLIDFGDVEACLDDLVELASPAEGDHAGQRSHEDPKNREELATIITMAAQIYYIYIGGSK